MSARQPRHPVECQGHLVVVREGVWDLVSGNHQGQRPRAPRKQAGHKTASDYCPNQLKNILLCRKHPHKTFATIITDNRPKAALGFKRAYCSNSIVGSIRRDIVRAGMGFCIWLDRYLTEELRAKLDIKFAFCQLRFLVHLRSSHLHSQYDMKLYPSPQTHHAFCGVIRVV